MNALVLIFNIGIPIIMILIGILYKYNLYKKTDKILELIIPTAMLFTGLSDDKTDDFSKYTNTLGFVNRKCSLIWSISGACTLLLTMIFIILNRSTIYSVGTKLLELECLVIVTVYITIQYILKRNFHKKIMCNFNLKRCIIV